MKKIIAFLELIFLSSIPSRKMEPDKTSSNENNLLTMEADNNENSLEKKLVPKKQRKKLIVLLLVIGIYIMHPYVIYELGKHVVNMVPTLLGVISDIVVPPFLDDAGKEKYDAEKFRTFENSDMSFIGGLLTGKKIGSEQTAQGLVYDEIREDWIIGSLINASPVGLYNRNGDWQPYINATAFLYETGRLCLYLLIIYFIIKMFRKKAK